MHMEMLQPLKSGHMQSQNQRNRLIQNTLLLLVGIALCCIVVEAFFIYHLYKTNTESHLDTAWIDAEYGSEKKTGSKKANLPLFLKPLKPLAHLTAVNEKPNKDGVMQWSDNTNNICHELEYSKGKLVVQKEGYYYIYSKVSFSPSSTFIHSVRNLTPRYLGTALDLLRDRRYQPNSPLKHLRSSFLGGIFHLSKNDAIFVHVNASSLVRLQTRSDNFFGMFML